MIKDYFFGYLKDFEQEGEKVEIELIREEASIISVIIVTIAMTIIIIVVIIIIVIAVAIAIDAIIGIKS